MESPVEMEQDEAPQENESIENAEADGHLRNLITGLEEEYDDEIEAEEGEEREEEIEGNYELEPENEDDQEQNYDENDEFEDEYEDEEFEDTYLLTTPKVVVPRTNQWSKLRQIAQHIRRSSTTRYKPQLEDEYEELESPAPAPSRQSPRKTAMKTAPPKVPTKNPVRKSKTVSKGKEVAESNKHEKKKEEEDEPPSLKLVSLDILVKKFKGCPEALSLLASRDAKFSVAKALKILSFFNGKRNRKNVDPGDKVTQRDLYSIFAVALIERDRWPVENPPEIRNIHRYLCEVRDMRNSKIFTGVEGKQMMNDFLNAHFSLALSVKDFKAQVENIKKHRQEQERKKQELLKEREELSNNPVAAALRTLNPYPLIEAVFEDNTSLMEQNRILKEAVDKLKKEKQEMTLSTMRYVSESGSANGFLQRKAEKNQEILRLLRKENRELKQDVKRNAPIVPYVGPSYNERLDRVPIGSTAVGVKVEPDTSDMPQLDSTEAGEGGGTTGVTGDVDVSRPRSASQDRPKPTGKATAKAMSKTGKRGRGKWPRKKKPKPYPAGMVYSKKLLLNSAARTRPYVIRALRKRRGWEDKTYGGEYGRLLSAQKKQSITAQRKPLHEDSSDDDEEKAKGFELEVNKKTLEVARVPRTRPNLFEKSLTGTRTRKVKISERAKTSFVCEADDLYTSSEDDEEEQEQPEETFDDLSMSYVDEEHKEKLRELKRKAKKLSKLEFIEDPDFKVSKVGAVLYKTPHQLKEEGERCLRSAKHKLKREQALIEREMEEKLYREHGIVTEKRMAEYMKKKEWSRFYKNRKAEREGRVVHPRPNARKETPSFMGKNCGGLFRWRYPKDGRPPVDDTPIYRGQDAVDESMLHQDEAALQEQQYYEDQRQYEEENASRPRQERLYYAKKGRAGPVDTHQQSQRQETRGRSRRAANAANPHDKRYLLSNPQETRRAVEALLELNEDQEQGEEDGEQRNEEYVWIENEQQPQSPGPSYVNEDGELRPLEDNQEEAEAQHEAEQQPASPRRSPRRARARGVKMLVPYSPQYAPNYRSPEYAPNYRGDRDREYPNTQRDEYPSGYEEFSVETEEQPKPKAKRGRGRPRKYKAAPVQPPQEVVPQHEDEVSREGYGYDGQDYVEEGLPQEEYGEEGVLQQYGEEGVPQDYYEEGEPQQYVEEGVPPEYLEEGVPQYDENGVLLGYDAQGVPPEYVQGEEPAQYAEQYQQDGQGYSEEQPYYQEAYEGEYDQHEGYDEELDNHIDDSQPSMTQDNISQGPTVPSKKLRGPRTFKYRVITKNMDEATKQEILAERKERRKMITKRREERQREQKRLEREQKQQEQLEAERRWRAEQRAMGFAVPEPPEAQGYVGDQDYLMRPQKPPILNLPEGYIITETGEMVEPPEAPPLEPVNKATLIDYREYQFVGRDYIPSKDEIDALFEYEGRPIRNYYETDTSFEIVNNTTWLLMEKGRIRSCTACNRPFSMNDIAPDDLIILHKDEPSLRGGEETLCNIPICARYSCMMKRYPGSFFPHLLVPRRGIYLNKLQLDHLKVHLAYRPDK